MRMDLHNGRGKGKKRAILSVMTKQISHLDHPH